MLPTMAVTMPMMDDQFLMSLLGSSSSGGRLPSRAAIRLLTVCVVAAAVIVEKDMVHYGRVCGMPEPLPIAYTSSVRPFNERMCRHQLGARGVVIWTMRIVEGRVQSVDVAHWIESGFPIKIMSGTMQQ